MRLLAAAALATALAVPFAPAAQAAPGVRATLEVTGRAGEVVTFALDRETRLGNGGYDSVVTSPGAGWSGVALTRTDGPDSRAGLDTYVHVDLRDAVLCPGRTCEPETFLQPTIAMDDDGRGYAVLKPGRYALALLGPAGAPVKATLRLRGPKHGRTALRTARKAAAYTGTTFAPVASPAGQVNRGFARVEPEGRTFVDLLAVAFAVESAGLTQATFCASGGGNRTFDGTVGGVAPCADGSGADFMFGPDARVHDEREVGIAYAGSAGRSQNASGLGFDAELAGEGHVSGLYVSVVF